jgi:hypothetical protein
MNTWDDQRIRSTNVNVIDCKLTVTTVTVRFGKVHLLMYATCSGNRAYDLLLSVDIDHFEDRIT